MIFSSREVLPQPAFALLASATLAHKRYRPVVFLVILKPLFIIGCFKTYLPAPCAGWDVVHLYLDNSSVRPRDDVSAKFLSFFVLCHFYPRDRHGFIFYKTNSFIEKERTYVLIISKL